MAARTLTDEMIMSGGWDARYTRVLHVNESGRVALVILDANGDGSQIYEEQWVKFDDGWAGTIGSSAGDWDTLLFSGSTPEVTGGFSGNAGFVWGTAPGLSVVTVEWFGRSHQVPVGPFDIWSFIEEFPEFSFDENGEWLVAIPEVPHRVA